VVVTHLLAPERAALLGMLEALDQARWAAPTVCPGWSVKDVVAHLLGDDLGLLSRRRDRFTPPGAPGGQPGWQQLVAWLDRENQAWVEAARRLSPRLLRELLAVTGEATSRHLAGLDPFALEARVSWAGPGPHPNWLDVAREYTGRWTHQQQVRDAVGVPGLREPEFLARCWPPSCTPCRRRSPVRRRRRAPPSRSPCPGRPVDAGRCCGHPPAGGWPPDPPRTRGPRGPGRRDGLAAMDQGHRQGRRAGRRGALG
jgi:uncharacterized protein (TIGR03083 family)